jgi:hypothetical protein
VDIIHPCGDNDVPYAARSSMGVEVLHKLFLLGGERFREGAAGVVKSICYSPYGVAIGRDWQFPFLGEGWGDGEMDTFMMNWS